MSEGEMTDYAFHTLSDAGNYVSQATALIEGELKQALKARGKATLLLSGGSSPKAVYEALSHSDLLWDKVTVSLVDERWVQEGEAGSNASFIKETLLQNKAADAAFISMVDMSETAQAGEAAIDKRFKTHFSDPVDVCVMGMGTDGHTASWFPQSPTLDKALNIHGDAAVVWQDATGQAGASGFPDRITVTLPFVMRARTIALLIPGSAKIKVWTESEQKDVVDRPVKALRAAGQRLHIFTHETA